MKFLLSVIDAVSGSATADEVPAIDAFNAELIDKGYWVMAAGVGAPETATVFDNRGGAGVVTQGGYVTADEFVAGFWIVDVPTEDIAREVATAGSRACNRKVELRPFLR
ncbi:MAG: YciI family protein [Microbacteriaceae bacterium]